jgi:hypothetical protein
MARNKYIIAFAGAVGSSKTPISSYLSWKLGLPVFNTDAIRSEVIEDLGELDRDEVMERVGQRLRELVKSEKSFILDASIDRKWGEYEAEFMKSGYEMFLVSMDLSKEKLIELYKAKEYGESLLRVDQLVLDHEEFLKNYGKIVNLRITDETFGDRLEIVEERVVEWVG